LRIHSDDDDQVLSRKDNFMSFQRFLRSWLGVSLAGQTRHVRRRRYRPEFEALETRVVPAGGASRTWVSNTGDDADPGSVTAPCKTFVGALNKTAIGGEVDALTPGGFGALTISQSISIEAIGVVAGVLASGTNGIVVNGGPSDIIVLNGLTIDGLDGITGYDGVRIFGGSAVFVENCTIKNFGDYGIEYTGTGKLFVTNTILSHNAMGGILLKPATGGVSATLNNVTIEGNQQGLEADDGARVEIANSIVAGNTTQGILVSSKSQPTAVNFRNTVVSLNGFNTLKQGAGAAISDAIKAAAPFAIAGLSNGETATVSKAYAPNLQVEVVDAFGDPVPGARVTFTAPTSGPRGAFGGAATGTAVTNADGVATAPAFTAGTIPGTFKVTASVGGVPTPATFSMKNVPGSPAKVIAQTVTPPNATVNEHYAPLSAEVTDTYGNPVSTPTVVTFSAPASGPSGSFTSSPVVLSNVSGMAFAPTFFANTTVGSFKVTASISGGARATFKLTNTAGKAAQILIVTGSNQKAAPGATFATLLKVKVFDEFGNPVSQAQVTFTVQLSAGTGAGGTFNGNGSVQVVTDSTGQATASTLKANGKKGSFTVVASVDALSMTFDLTII
jgi:protocatechuate 3,4-dioxygenase beta subunit